MSKLNTTLLGILFCVPCAAAHAETLNVLIWEKYISPKLVENWTAKSGVEVRQIFYDSGDVRDRLLADPDSDIDVAILNENTALVLSRKDHLVPINETTVPSVQYSVPRWRERCSGYGMPYFWGTLGIVYRPDKVATAPTSWTDILAPSADLSRHVAMVPGSDDLLTPALILTGKSINSSDQSDLKEAFDLLKIQSPSVRTYSYIVTSAQDKTFGPELYMALAYSGDQFVLSDATSTPWRFAVPKEGTVIWVDCMAVNAKSKRRGFALDFLNFINEPRNAADNAAYLQLPTTNLAALDLLPEGMTQNLEIFPPQSIIDASQFYGENTPEAVQTRKRISNALLNFHDTQ